MTCHAHSTECTWSIKTIRVDCEMFISFYWWYSYTHIFPHESISFAYRMTRIMNDKEREEKITISLRFNLHLIREIFAWHKIIRWDVAIFFLSFLLLLRLALYMGRHVNRDSGNACLNYYPNVCCVLNKENLFSGSRKNQTSTNNNKGMMILPSLFFPWW